MRRPASGPLAAVRVLTSILALLLTGCAGEDSPSDEPSPVEEGNSGGIVGSFQVQVDADQADAASGTTAVIGKLNDAPTPANRRWEVLLEEGGCRLEEPVVPFCEEGCGSDVCVDDGVCQPYPTPKNAGDVTLVGVNLEGGGSELLLKPIANVYQPPAGTQIAFPPFGEGEPVTIRATGGDVAAFELNAPGVAPITFTSTSFELDLGKPFELTWPAAADPQASSVHVKLDISHHGGSRGQIVCEVADTGSLTISAALMTELIGLGVAGFPSVILTRSSVDLAETSLGVVELEVSSQTERYVTVVGFESCNADEDCADGKTCQTDLTCG